MNMYIKAMLNSYLVPVAIFYMLPFLVLLVFSIGSLFVFQVLGWVLVFPLSVFVVGALLAPLFGPKVLKQKSLSFLMAAIVNLVAITVFKVFLCAFTNNWNLGESIEFILAFGAFCFFPCMLGGYLFIGGCERIEGI